MTRAQRARRGTYAAAELCSTLSDIQRPTQPISGSFPKIRPSTNRISRTAPRAVPKIFGDEGRQCTISVKSTSTRQHTNFLNHDHITCWRLEIGTFLFLRINTRVDWFSHHPYEYKAMSDKSRQGTTE